MSFRKFQRAAQQATALSVPMGGGGNPFSDNSAMSENNIFNQLESGKIGAGREPRGMPEGMPERPPASASDAIPGHTSESAPSREGSQIESAVARNQGSSPLDKYTKMVDTKGDEEGEGQGNQEEKRDPSVFDFKVDDYRKQFSSQNLVGEIDEELAHKALREGDTKAFSQILNQVATNAATIATYSSSQVARHGMNEFDGRIRNELPKSIRDQQFSSMWDDQKHDILSKPELRPMVDSATQMFRREYPQASTKDIQSYVENYLKDAAQAMGFQAQPEPTQEDNRRSRGGDMSDFFG